ncbi:hypothetical protein Prudu_1167S000100 [Prunus dulcis]|uniref:Uncharacterized protein n=1 Tax=Prunus dulcis TaxID=3755 RepID=A0A5H2Y6M5_PRUDU|nr:hypothetical protein L3X38_007892 [Prunus dulcis]BBN69766.1 hypothetical protein Prudu_1167S000100 [Prunus dulcis]
MEGSDQAPHDIENPCIPLVTSMSEELDGLSSLSSSCCIHRVPERLRRVSENAYTPQVVSIGPLHHGKEGLKAMEDHKKRYLQDYIRRTRVSQADYLQKVKDQEVKLRSCYAETIQVSSDEFVRIILVDAAFIIEVLLRYRFDELQMKMTAYLTDHGCCRTYGLTCGCLKISCHSSFLRNFLLA